MKPWRTALQTIRLPPLRVPPSCQVAETFLMVEVLDLSNLTVQSSATLAGVRAKTPSSCSSLRPGAAPDILSSSTELFPVKEGVYSEDSDWHISCKAIFAMSTAFSSNGRNISIYSSRRKIHLEHVPLQRIDRRHSCSSQHRPDLGLCLGHFFYFFALQAALPSVQFEHSQHTRLSRQNVRPSFLRTPQ